MGKEIENYRDLRNRGKKLVELTHTQTPLSYREILDLLETKRPDCFKAALFSEVALTDENLTEYDFSEANLSRVCLINCNLSSADFSRAILTEADLSNAQLIDCDLSGDDLSYVNLTDARLDRASLTDVNLRGAFVMKDGRIELIRRSNFEKLFKFEAPEDVIMLP